MMLSMELLALAAIGLMSLIGWVIAAKCFGRWIDNDSRFYFAPAIGMAGCATIGYLACHTRQVWLIPFCVVIVVIVFVRSGLRKELNSIGNANARRVFHFTLLAFLCLYAIQNNLFHLFKGISPGPHEVWDLFNVTGVSPPDQMFAWHQAMFADQHRHYPQDPFYADMDLYDRPHLGGYLTLFFFKLFNLPLVEDQWAYPSNALRFYHCFWWLLNNFYLLGIAPLFQHIFGYRAAVLAVASTALSGFVLLCNMGGWMKFSTVYVFLLAVLLFLEGKGPVLQALLCVTSFYLHGSILPFLLGFGLLQILCLYYPIRPRSAHLSDAVWFSVVGIFLVGAWFIVVRWVGSKQPLLYYYVYNAGLTQAQTEPVADIAKAFYAKHSWSSLSLLPIHNLKNSFWPVHFSVFLGNLFVGLSPWKIQSLASAVFQSQRFCIFAAVSLVTLPVVLVGTVKTLSTRYAGRVMLALYLIPTMFIGLVYRIDWPYSLHVVCLYHTFVLFFWVFALKNWSLLIWSLGLAAIAFEGAICVIFADLRFLPVSGIDLGQLTHAGLWHLLTYLCLLSVVFGGAWLAMRLFPPDEAILGSSGGSIAHRWISVAGKLILGFAIIGAIVAGYSVYCLQLY